MYSVGDRTFSTIQEARAYDFETSGTIDNVKAVTSEETISQNTTAKEQPLRGFWLENSGISANEWIELLNNFLRTYYEDQDTDDIDRVFRSQEAQALDDLFTRYANGEATVDELAAFEIDFLRDVDGVSEWWDQTVSIAEADRIIGTLETNPAELANIPAPTGTKTSEYVENGALTFAGATPTTPIAVVGDKRVVLRGGTGVTVDIEQVIGAGGRIFGEGGMLDAVIPYIPGISLPNWMPTAGVIFLPSVGETIDKISAIIAETDITDAIEEGDIGEILNDIGTIIVGTGSEVVSEVQAQVTKILGQIQGTVADPTQAGTLIGGIFAGSFPSGIPDWLGGILAENVGRVVYGAARTVLVDSGTATEEQLPPITQEEEEDPALMFTHRGSNYFVNKELDEFFQLAESEEYQFELNSQFTREQLQETGLETINSGTYQSLLDDLSFHALEEDIFQYPIEDLIARYEEEGGVLPDGWEEMDAAARYNFFLGDYFDIEDYVADIPEEGEEEEQDVTSIVEGLFADFLEQLDTEFTGQQEQINTIINNFVETLPDFDAMPTMEDIAEYFELNGVTLSEQNFERIRQELANAGYLTEEQLTEALAGVATTEQVQEAIQGAGFATAEQVIQALAEAGYATPDDIATALSNSGFLTEEQFNATLAEAGYLTEEQLITALADVATTEEVQEALQGAGFATLDEVRLALSEAGYLTEEEFRLTTEELRQAISDLPDGATEEEVRQIIQEAIDSLPGSGEGLSVDDVREIINEAISGIALPDAVTEEQVRSILDSFGFSTSEEVQAGFENIQENFEDLTSRFNDAINGIATEFSEQEALFLESITGLEASLIQSLSNIEGGLSAELEMLDTNIIALQEAVEAGFDDFATFATEQFGLASDERRALQEAIIAVDGNVTQLSADFQREFEEFGGTLAELFEGVGFSIEDLQQGQISQAEAFESLNSYLAEQFQTAQQERQSLQEAILNVGGDVNLLSDTMFEQFQAQNETLEELFAGTNVNIEALALGQISQTEAINQFQDYVADEFLAAQEDRIRITEALISVNGNLEELNLASLDTFNELNLSIEELANEFNVNFEALQQGQISQYEAYNEFQDNVTQRLDISNQQLEDILAGQDDILSGQRDILSGQEDIIMGQEEFQILYGEQQQALEDQIMAGNVLNALAAGGMFAPAAAAPARAPYEEFLQGITYRPREVPELAIKTPVVDYNEEAQQLLMRTRRRGMLA